MRLSNISALAQATDVTPVPVAAAGGQRGAAALVLLPSPPEYSEYSKTTATQSQAPLTCGIHPLPPGI